METIKIKEFKFINNIQFYKTDIFIKALNRVHNVYVFKENDKITIEDIEKNT